MIDRRTLVATAAAFTLATLVQATFANQAAAEGYDVSGIAVDPALSARVPAKIRTAGVLSIGSDNAYAPWEYLAGQDGQTPEGIDVDLAKAMGAKLGLEIDFQTSAFDAIMPSLGTKFDLGISAFSITQERMKVVNFVSYAESGNLWAVKAGNPAAFDPADYCGRVIAVQSGTWHEGMIQDASKACADAGKPAVEILPFGVQTEALTRVAAGGADATITGDSVIAYAALQSRGTLETMEAVGILNDSGLNGIAVAKPDMELTRLIADTMNAMIKDGTYGAIFAQWGIGSLAVPQAEINPPVKD